MGDEFTRPEGHDFQPPIGPVDPEHPECAAVMCSRGGYGCSRLFPFIDLDRMAASGKMLCGFSDITVLHLALNRRGLVTMHTPMPITLSYEREPWVHDSFFRLLQGAMVLVAQANGARDYARCGAIWRVALIHAAVLGAVFMAIPFAAEPLFLAIGHSAELAHGAAQVTWQFAWGMPGMLLYICCGYFMEGIGRPRAGMIIMLAANVANVIADGILVAGWWNLVAPMGAAGAVMTTSALRWGIFVAMLTVVLTRRDRAVYGHVIDYADLHFGTWRPFLVFNLADAAITIGVLIILARSFLSRERKDHAGQPATES